MIDLNALELRAESTCAGDMPAPCEDAIRALLTFIAVRQDIIDLLSPESQMRIREQLAVAEAAVMDVVSSNSNLAGQIDVALLDDLLDTETQVGLDDDAATFSARLVQGSDPDTLDNGSSEDGPEPNPEVTATVM